MGIVTSLLSMHGNQMCVHHAFISIQKMSTKEKRKIPKRNIGMHNIQWETICKRKVQRKRKRKKIGKRQREMKNNKKKEKMHSKKEEKIRKKIRKQMQISQMHGFASFHTVSIKGFK